VKFPIKYIENNLVCNQRGEWYAYYEVIPFNYSFLSQQEKLAVGENFESFVSQLSGGSVHLLQIATEIDIRKRQERSRSEIKGDLAEIAQEIHDAQTEALLQPEVGGRQMAYRYYIGFQLDRDKALSAKGLFGGAVNALKDFLYSVNHYLADDYVRINEDEIYQFIRAEEFLEHRISRHFAIRKLTTDDYGYILEHLYGTLQEPYEAYSNPLKIKKRRTERMVKQYDLLRPIRSLILDKPRCLQMTNRHDESVYVSYLALSAITDELAFPNSEIFYHQQGLFPFPIDTSIHVEVLPNRKGLSKVRGKKKELKDLESHAWQSNSETSRSVLDALESADELEHDLEQTRTPLHQIHLTLRVAAPSEDELKRWCGEVIDEYERRFKMKLIRPYGDMMGLHQEFIPGSRGYVKDYMQYVKSDFLASLGFGATQELGDNSGFYIGYCLETKKHVYIDPPLPAQGVDGSITNALAMAILGALGWGKSLFNNLLIYYSILRGGKAIILDPKSERGHWPEYLPEIAHETNVVHIKNTEENRGLLDPYVIMARREDSEALAVDVLTYLTGITARDGDKFPVLMNAIERVTQSETRGLLCVVDELRQVDTEVSRGIASHIESIARAGIAHLLFSRGDVQNTIRLDSKLNILQVAGLSMPDSQVDPSDYTIVNQLSIAILLVISTFSLDFIHSDTTTYKIVDLEEAWSFLQVAQGKALSMRLVRAGRSMNASAIFVTQNAGDLLDEKMRNNIGLRFAFHSSDMSEVRNVLKFMGVDPDDEANQKAVMRLGKGQCLMRDLYGRVGVVQIHPVFNHLLTAFDTRPNGRAGDDEEV